jgi:hypothetical protein
MSLPVDVVDKVLQDFPKDESVIILQLMNEFEQTKPEWFTPRILRCIIFLSKGKFEKFASTVKEAQTDWRDVIVAAEYEDWNDKPVRDFNLPFET